MKTILTLAAIAAAALPGVAAEKPLPANPKILIVYFSWSPAGNTKAFAEEIQRRVGGELLRIEPAKAYPKNYDTCVEQARGELKAGHYFKPELKTTLPASLDSYDVIFLGSPCWWGTMGSPMWTFVSKYDWKDRVVIPFNTNGGSGFGRTVIDIRETCKGATVLTGKAIRDYAIKKESARAEIADWLKSIGLRMRN